MLSDHFKPISSDNVSQQGIHTPKNSSHNKNNPFEALQTAFLHSLQAQGYRASTVDSYEKDLATLSKWLKKQNLHILELSEEDLQRYKSWAYTTQQKRTTTVNRYLATIRRFFRWAQRIGYRHSPPHVPKCFAQTPPCIRWLCTNQQRRLLRTLKRQQHTRNHSIILLLLNTGLRVSEICGIQWKDIQMTERGGAVCVRQAKGQRERTLPLNAAARAAIHQLGYDRNAGKKETLLQGQRGPLVTRSLQRIVRKHGRQADIENISPHSLRHTFCKNLIDAGVGLETVARLAGHAHIQTTRRYCEPAWKDLENAVTLLTKKGVIA